MTPIVKAESDEPTRCDSCENWNQHTAPFKIYANTYYVGVQGLSSVLISTSKGLILLDGDLPQSAPIIEANIRTLGFRVEDIRYILNSHAHADHAGGIAALQRHSGAEVIASVEGATPLLAGHLANDDPQNGFKSTYSFPRVDYVKTIKDGVLEISVSQGGITFLLRVGFPAILIQTSEFNLRQSNLVSLTAIQNELNQLSRYTEKIVDLINIAVPAINVVIDSSGIAVQPPNIGRR